MQGSSLNEKFKRTEQSDKYIRDLGYQLVTMWECEWARYRSRNTTVNPYLTPTETQYRMTQQELLAAILDGRLFGVVECDLLVPDHLKPYFSEMPPIFKKATVTESDIGAFMQAHLRGVGKTFKPTNYLIGSMFGTKIAVITPLLEWYLRHGVQITKVHQIVEFTPNNCFQRFADQVSQDRREGDRNPDFQPVAETSKLIGNSFYGWVYLLIFDKRFIYLY